MKIYRSMRFAAKTLAVCALVVGVGLIYASGTTEAAVNAPDAGVLGLPTGFKAAPYYSGLTTPRFVSFSPEGDLYVAEFGLTNNEIKVLPDHNHNGKPDDVITFAGGFLSPNNVTFHDGSVYVGEFGRVWRLQDTTGDLVADTKDVFIGGLPADGRHKTKTIEWGPDGKFYMNIGSYNDDAQESDTRATIWQYNADGSGGRVFARGLRNTVGFGWDLTTGLMWGVDNQADYLGTGYPPDELNQLQDGGDYGYPFCVGNQEPNPELGGRNCGATIPPVLDFPPHSAPLGMAFYSGPVSSFPESYWGGLFVAQHSINYPDNRAIVFVPFKDGKPSGPAQPFFSTGDTWVGLAVDPYDGSLFATQDRTGTIYKITYTGDAPAPVPPSNVMPTAVAGSPAPVLANQLPGIARCFDATGHCLRGAFLDYWSMHGGLAQFGLPVTDELTEKLEDGNSYTVQYTERARFELHPENQGKESYVLLGRLGIDLSAGREGEDPFKPVPPCGSCNLLYFAETQHFVGEKFQVYWQGNGGIPVFGYPLSEAFDEQSPTDGKTYLVQYFERNRLEYHPENAGTPFETLLGLLGTQKYASVYGANP
jgi:glucose/arabinose dehydrogenase